MVAATATEMEAAMAAEMAKAPTCTCCGRFRCPLHLSSMLATVHAPSPPPGYNLLFRMPHTLFFMPTQTPFRAVFLPNDARPSMKAPSACWYHGWYARCPLAT